MASGLLLIRGLASPCRWIVGSNLLLLELLLLLLLLLLLNLL